MVVRAHARSARDAPNGARRPWVEERAGFLFRPIVLERPSTSRIRVASKSYDITARARRINVETRVPERNERSSLPDSRLIR
jgi:hypothetical protein